MEKTDKKREMLWEEGNRRGPLAKTFLLTFQLPIWECHEYLEQLGLEPAFKTVLNDNSPRYSHPYVVSHAGKAWLV